MIVTSPHISFDISHEKTSICDHEAEKKFKPQIPIMKITVSVLPLVLGGQGPCRVGASDHRQCQQLCDATSFCEAWSYKGLVCIS